MTLEEQLEEQLEERWKTRYTELLKRLDRAGLTPPRVFRPRVIPQTEEEQDALLAAIEYASRQHRLNRHAQPSRGWLP